jgi:hypothetical protein
MRRNNKRHQCKLVEKAIANIFIYNMVELSGKSRVDKERKMTSERCTQCVRSLRKIKNDNFFDGCPSQAKLMRRIHCRDDSLHHHFEKIDSMSTALSRFEPASHFCKSRVF